MYCIHIFQLNQHVNMQHSNNYYSICLKCDYDETPSKIQMQLITLILLLIFIENKFNYYYYCPLYPPQTPQLHCNRLNQIINKILGKLIQNCENVYAKTQPSCYIQIAI